MKNRSRRSARREAGQVFVPTGRGRAPDVGGQLDVARCPLCDGPMTPRLNRQGSYFYCFCHAREEERPAPRLPHEEIPIARTIETKRLVGCGSPRRLSFPSCNNNLSSVG
jgi:hypothetical protein